MGLIKKDRKTYAIVLADGKIRVQTTEDNPEAVKRDFESSDGKCGTKYELVYDQLEGRITDVSFKEGEFGTQIQVEIDGIVLSMNTSSNYAEDFMKKLPNVNLDEVVTVSPYNFTDKQGKNWKGISIVQGIDNKIVNYFYDAETKKNIHDFPDIPKVAKGKKLSKDDWKIYFISVRKFLIEFVEENIKPLLISGGLPAFANEKEKEVESEEEEIDVETEEEKVEQAF